MQTNEQMLSAIENYLAQTEFPAEPELLYAPIGYSLAGGGKRLRPMLLTLSCGIFSDDVKQALPAAAAVEVFHNFTLLHDDIMDNAAVRRGKPSVHAKWGQNVAILSGDAMMIYAYRLLSSVPANLLPQVLSTFNTMALEVCEGQQYDMDFEQKPKVSVVEYMHMIELKTSVLLAGSVVIGAMLGGASDEDCRRLRRFAVELGLAFQLQDDLLDSYGDQRQGHRGRHPRRQEDLPDDHGDEPCRRGDARDAAHGLPRPGALRRREDRQGEVDLRPAGRAAPDRAADPAAFRTCAVDPRHPFGGPFADTAHARLRHEPDGPEKLNDETLRH